MSLNMLHIHASAACSLRMNKETSTCCKLVGTTLSRSRRIDLWLCAWPHSGANAFMRHIEGFRRAAQKVQSSQRQCRAW